ncbi:TPA: hypothetical protein QHM91_001864 [Escherichia coli]|nr:hypothetical protein [Escherichia coli]
MSHSIFKVEFEDGFCLFGVNDTTACFTYRFLFHSPEEVNAWIFCNTATRPVPEQPAIAEQTAEPVIFDPDKTWSFATRASRVALWLTGPVSREESDNESWESDDTLPYGGVIFD